MKQNETKQMNAIVSSDKTEPDRGHPPGEDDELDKIVLTLFDIEIVCSFLQAETIQHLM
jgi:hypothetical protein